MVQTSVERLLRRNASFCWCRGVRHGFHGFLFDLIFHISSRTQENDGGCKKTHNVYVTKLVEPKVIHRVGRGHKITFAKLFVCFRGGDVELV
jgi:hypothetical protein